MLRRLKVTDINSLVVCTICDGYLVDATAIIECLHAFCRTCIVRYLETNKFCPVCDVQVHKTKPLQSIRSDQTLQDLVYKMVPELYQNEMQRRREFYAEYPNAAVGRTPEECGEGEPRFFSPKENISISLQLIKPSESKTVEKDEAKDPMTRHLNCPAAFTVGHVKKFILLKFSLPPNCKVEVFYDDHPMIDSFTLMDVAYIYSWKRAEPMKFFYSIVKRIPKCIEPPPPPPSEAITPPIADVEVVHSKENAAEIVPEILPAAIESTASLEPELMEIDPETTTKNESMVLENTPKVEASVETSEIDAPSSTNESSEQKVQEDHCKSSQPIKSIPAPLMPEPTYNSVKVVSAPEPNTLLSPTNGFRLKFIHDPDLNAKKSGSKKPGRKKSSKHKGPVRLARLAPYPPPPPPPVSCLTANQHLSQLTVGKLVPSVITTLAPTFVTTLVSTTSNSVCSNATNNASSVSTFLGPSPAVCTITAPSALLPQVLSSTTENVVTLSSSASTVTVSTCPQGATINPVLDSLIHTKELSHSDSAPSISASAPSSEPTSISCNSDTPVLPNKSHSSVCDTSSLINSVADSQTKTHVPDSSVCSSPKPVVSSSTKDIVGSDIVTSTSVDPIVPVSVAVPIPHANCDASGALKQKTDIKISNELKLHTHISSETHELNGSLTSHSSVTSHNRTEEKNIASSALIISNTKVPEKGRQTSEESGTDQRSLESLTFNSIEKTNNSLTQKCEEREKCAEISKSINGHNDLNRFSPKESTLVIDTKSIESFKKGREDKVFQEILDNNNRSLEEMVKGSISAEFSDNDDLGCQSDLVVDEQKVDDSSDNEDETDAALRKKINAIAEKEDETDDTEADSGRASDMSCPARCEEDVGSPMAVDQAPASNASTSQHHSKSNNIDNVIKQLYLQHEIGRSPSSPKPSNATTQQQQQPEEQQRQQDQRDDAGVLDLSTCTRKPGETSVQGSRPRTVANPVLDIKHRQQTYLPAPVRQHTACVPTPKPPTSSPLLMHHLTGHTSILQAQLTGKSPLSHHPHPVAYSPYPLPNSNNRLVSSPSPLAGRPSPPSYSYRFPHQNVAALQHQGLAGMLPYSTAMNNMTGFGPRAGMTLPSSNNSRSKSPTSSFNSNAGKTPDRKNWSPTPSTRKLPDTIVASGPNCRGPSALPTSPTSVPAHPRASPSMLRLSPLHKSASPAPSPHSVSSSANSGSNIFSMTTSTASMTTSSQSKQSVPIYKKSDSYKSYNKFKRSANLAVFNPDPNGYRQKLVIKNLDSKSKSNSNSNSHHHHHHHHHS